MNNITSVTYDEGTSTLNINYTTALNGDQSFSVVLTDADGTALSTALTNLQDKIVAASEVTVADTNNYFTGTNVEDVLAELKESINTISGDVEGVEYKIEQLDTPTSELYSASYKLVDNTGTQKGDTINIPKDSAFKSAEITTNTEGNRVLRLTYTDSTGTE